MHRYLYYHLYQTEKRCNNQNKNIPINKNMNKNENDFQKDNKKEKKIEICHNEINMEVDNCDREDENNCEKTEKEKQRQIKISKNHSRHGWKILKIPIIIKNEKFTYKIPKIEKSSSTETLINYFSFFTFFCPKSKDFSIFPFLYLIEI